MPRYSKEAQKKKPWHEVTLSPAERKANREKTAKAKMPKPAAMMKLKEAIIGNKKGGK